MERDTEPQEIPTEFGLCGYGGRTNQKQRKWPEHYRMPETLTKPPNMEMKPYCNADCHVLPPDRNDGSGTLICSLNSRSLDFKCCVLARRPRQLCGNHTREVLRWRGGWEASYLHPICCFHGFNVGNEKLRVGSRGVNILNSAVYHRSHYGWWHTPMMLSNHSGL